MSRPIYLDYASATPMDDGVKRSMNPFFDEEFYNPSAPYLAGKAVKVKLEDARASVANLLGAKSSEIFFTAGATEANNLAIQGLMRKYPEGEVVISAIEHESVRAPAKLFNSHVAGVKHEGLVDLDLLESKITDKTVLISVMMVNNELGTLQPLRDISMIVDGERKKRLSSQNKLPIFLHSDAAQAPNLFDLHVQRLGADLFSLNGGKIYGPKQSGILFVKSGIEMEAQILGGGQERGLRSGTENVAGAVGFATALEIAQKTRVQEIKRLGELRRFFVSELNRFSSVVINGSAKHQSPHIVSATFRGQDNERLMMELDEAGIQSAVGSACSAATAEVSHVLSAIGLSNEDARSTLRFSFGRQTSKVDLNKTIGTLKDIID